MRAFRRNAHDRCGLRTSRGVYTREPCQAAAHLSVHAFDERSPPPLRSVKRSKALMNEGEKPLEPVFNGRRETYVFDAPIFLGTALEEPAVVD